MLLISVASAMAGTALWARTPNYDEMKVAPYTLENPLAFADGRPVSSPADWSARRAEILEIFAHEMYGVEPPMPEALVTELIESGETLGGLGERRQYRMWFKTDKSGPYLDWLVILPKHRPGHLPVVLFLNYYGNHELLDDPEVFVPDNVWLKNNAEHGIVENRLVHPIRAAQRQTTYRYTFPVEVLAARGYAVVSACYGQVSPDVDVRKGDAERIAYERGVFSLWPPRDASRTDNTTALGAWAWALSRGLDLTERLPEIDARRSLVTGCSRLAKAALLAAARDTRFAVCAPVQTGGGGAPLAKRDFGENVSTEMKSFPHWYCRAYARYVDNEASLPFDQHLLLAAVAPRRLLVLGFDAPWFDTKGEFLSCRAASSVWAFLGRRGLPSVDWPQPFKTTAIGADLGYYRRLGKHGISAYDWNLMLDFADRTLQSEAWDRRGQDEAMSFRYEGKFLPQLDVNAFIENAAAQGGGRVVIPEGVWECDPIELKSNVELHLSAGAELLFTDDLEKFLPAVRTSYEGIECYNYRPLIYAFGATNIAITGRGTIRPMMGRWETWRWNAPTTQAAKKRLTDVWGAKDIPVEARDLTKLPGAKTRPQFIGLNGCRDVRLEGFTLRDSPFWCIHLLTCEDVAVRGLSLRAFLNNSDGIDVECSRNVTIEDCSFDQGDDVIVLKSGKDRDGRRRATPTENVTIRRCRAGSGHGFLVVGSECSGGIRNVTLEDCLVDGSLATLFKVKTSPKRGGFIENISMRRVKARTILDSAIDVKAYYALNPSADDAEDVLTQIRGLTVEDVSVDRAGRRWEIVGDERAPIRAVSIARVVFAGCERADVLRNAEVEIR